MIDVVNGSNRPGDVINERGDILVRNPQPLDPDALGVLTTGTVTVTLEQAENAKRHGWIELIASRRQGLTEVTRGVLSQ